jgi:uncharacterized membrane-anchored protein
MTKSALEKGLLIAALHLILVSSLAAKYAYERATRPRVWAQTTNYDPDLPVRGRYMGLQLHIEAPGLFEDKPLIEEKSFAVPAAKPSPCDAQNDKAGDNKKHYRWERQEKQVRLDVENGSLIAKADPKGNITATWNRDGEGRVTIAVSEPVLFFIPEHALIRRIERDEQLWAEVTVPSEGPPRPIRLGVKHSNGEITPLRYE